MLRNDQAQHESIFVQTFGQAYSLKFRHLVCNFPPTLAVMQASLSPVSYCLNTTVTTSISPSVNSSLGGIVPLSIVVRTC